ncbi:MAG TPA: C2 family cysteine protease [Tepidisphaeraceae bacterium]|nr:C2 family cysteine protease [Tepidisphaeraceae bacterium]
MKMRADNLFGQGLESLESRTLMAAVPLNVVSLGTQLKIIGTAGNDQISIKYSGSNLLITNTGGWSTTVAGTFKTIVVDGGAGNDAIGLDATITQNAVLYGSAGNDTLVGGSGNDRIYGGDGTDSSNGGAGNDVIVSIGGTGLDKCIGGAGTDSFWADTTDTITDAVAAETAVGAVHRVNNFMFNVSKELLGQSIGDSKTTSSSYVYHRFANNPLFSDAGPSPDDVHQGAVGDCYFLSVLSSVAKTDPQLIRQSVVDLGDGTYAVQFTQGTTKTFVRVDADLPAYSWGGLAYAGVGAQSSMWVAIMEKAFTVFRYSAGTYASISSGWMSEVYADLGKTSFNAYTSTSAAWLMQTVQTALAGGKSVTFAVSKAPSGAPLIGSHAYMVQSVVFDSKGKVSGLRLRNPWGIDGAGNDGLNDGYVTITAAQAQAALLGLSTSIV